MVSIIALAGTAHDTMLNDEEKLSGLSPSTRDTRLESG